MTTDLTQPLIAARERAQEWTQETFWKTVELLLEKLPDTFLRFDYDAGEEWASIRWEEDLVALVRYDAPLIIIVEGSAKKVQPFLESNQIVTILVESMESKIYSIKPSKIGEIFPKNDWPSEIPSDQLSIGDLWWATIT